MSSTSRSVSRSVVRALRTVSLAIVLLAAQAAGQSVKLNAPLFHFLDFYFEDGVLETRVSSDGRWCVYRAKEKSQEPGLFSVRVDGSESSRRLVPEGMDVEGFVLSAQLVVVLSQHNLFVVPIDASRPPAPILPWNPLRNIDDDDFGINSDASRVVYMEQVPGTTKRELYSADIHGVEPPVKLNPVLPAGNISGFELGPDPGRVVYDAAQDRAGVAQVLSVPIDGSSVPVDLCPPTTATGRTVREIVFSPDGTRVVFRIDQDRRSVFELFSAPIDGSSAAVKLNSSLPSGRNVLAQFQISTDGKRVVYMADQLADEVFEIFSAPIDASTPAVKLNGPLVPGSDVDFGFEISPNSRLVAFIAQRSATEAALWVAPIDGRFAARTILSDPMTMGRFTPDSRRVVTRVRKDDGPIDLFSASVARGGILNLTRTGDEVGQWVFEFVIPPDGASVVYVESFSGFTEIRKVPLDGHSDPVALSSFWAREDLTLTGDGRFVLFRGVPYPEDVHRLYSLPVDGHRGMLELNGPLVADQVIGDVRSMKVSPQGAVAFAVYVPQYGYFLDNDFWELFGVVPGNSPDPVRLSPDRAERRIPAYEFDASGQRVVFKAGYSDLSGFNLFVSPVDGHEPPLQLDDPETTFNAIGEFVLSTDEPFAVFDADVGSWSELFRVALDGGPEVSLSGDLVAGGGFEDFQLAPGSGRVVYVADQLVNERFELFSVASDGSAAPVRLNGTLPANADVDQEFVIHPDGSTVVALGELLANDVRELFRIPVDGSAVPARISAPLVAGGNVERGFRLGPDGRTVVYVADQEQDERFELYAVDLDGATAPVELSGALVTGGDVQTDFAFTPDGRSVVYRADAGTDERFELFVVALDGSTAPLRLNPALVAEGDVRSGFLLTPDSKRVLFRSDRSADERIELFSALIDGGGSLVVNGLLAPGGQVADLLRLGTDGQQVFYVADQRADELFELFEAPVDREKAARVVSAALLPGGDVSALEPTPDGKGILYLADQETDGVVELFLSFLAPALRPMHPPRATVGVR